MAGKRRSPKATLSSYFRSGHLCRLTRLPLVVSGAVAAVVAHISGVVLVEKVTKSPSSGGRKLLFASGGSTLRARNCPRGPRGGCG